MALANLSIYCTWKNIKTEYNNKEFQISVPTWNDTFDLPDGSYFIADIQYYFESIVKKHETVTENPAVQIYQNKIKNRAVFEIKTGCKLELLTPETMKLLGNGKKTLTKIKKEKMNQNWNLLKLFKCTVIQSKMIIDTLQKFCLLFSKALEIKDNVNLTILVG